MSETPPTRSFLDWQIQDATLRMQATSDEAQKLKWALVITKARRARRELAASAAPVGQESGIGSADAIPVSPPEKVLAADSGESLPLPGGPAPAAPTAGDRYNERRDAAARAWLDRPGERHDEDEP